MFPIGKLNNNIFFLDTKTMTSLGTTITYFCINSIEYVHYSVFKVFSANDLNDTGNIFLMVVLVQVNILNF